MLFGDRVKLTLNPRDAGVGAPSRFHNFAKNLVMVPHKISLVDMSLTGVSAMWWRSPEAERGLYESARNQESHGRNAMPTPH